MNVLQFIKDEGYISARYSSIKGDDIHLQINELTSSEDLFALMQAKPTSITYYPYERVPYLDCKIDQQVLKLKLLKP